MIFSEHKVIDVNNELWNDGRGGGGRGLLGAGVDIFLIDFCN